MVKTTVLNNPLKLLVFNPVHLVSIGKSYVFTCVQLKKSCTMNSGFMHCKVVSLCNFWVNVIIISSQSYLYCVLWSFIRQDAYLTLFGFFPFSQSDRRPIASTRRLQTFASVSCYFKNPCP